MFRNRRRAGEELVRWWMDGVQNAEKNRRRVRAADRAEFDERNLSEV